MPNIFKREKRCLKISVWHSKSASSIQKKISDWRSKVGSSIQRKFVLWKICFVLFCFTEEWSVTVMSILCSLAKIKETRGNVKSKNISCDFDLTNDDLQNEDYSYAQPSNSETGLGVLDHGSAKEAERNVCNNWGKYIKYLAVQRYKIGKYASEYSTASTLHKYKGKFPQLNESTVRSMRQKYKEELPQSLKEKQEPKTKLPTARHGRRLMLGIIDLMLQNYITVCFVLIIRSLFLFKKEK